MIKVNREICGMTPPQRRVSVRLFCDECGRECIPAENVGAQHERLYEYDGAQLCYNCLLELLFDTADYAVVTAEYAARNEE